MVGAKTVDHVLTTGTLSTVLSKISSGEAEKEAELHHVQ
jgi:hypothetical protein